MTIAYNKLLHERKSFKARNCNTRWDILDKKEKTLYNSEENWNTIDR